MTCNFNVEYGWIAKASDATLTLRVVKLSFIIKYYLIPAEMQTYP